MGVMTHHTIPVSGHLTELAWNSHSASTNTIIYIVVIKPGFLTWFPVQLTGKSGVVSLNNIEVLPGYLVGIVWQESGGGYAPYASTWNLYIKT
jgi:hypothetical protein